MYEVKLGLRVYMLAQRVMVGIVSLRTKSKAVSLHHLSTKNKAVSTVLVPVLIHLQVYQYLKNGVEDGPLNQTVWNYSPLKPLNFILKH